MSSTPTYRQFFTDTLAALGAEATHGNLRCFATITLIEGRNSYWNPMNWTLPTKFPAFNSTGVREYPDYATGVKWTAKNLLDNERWAPFVTVLRANHKTRDPGVEAVAAIYAEWGSHPDFFGITPAQAVELLDEEMP